MCNHLSLSSHMDKTHSTLFYKEKKGGACVEFFGEKAWGVRKPCAQVGSLKLPREKERVFSEFPRVLAWGSGSEKVSYECRELTKF